MHRAQSVSSVVSGLIGLGLLVAGAGCASHKAGSPGAKVAKGDATDASACQTICAASAACGDAPEVCEPKCRDWLVTRSRPGIASATARCAVPRIDGVCADSQYARAAATALVACIDEAGRVALKKDHSALLVAARAICERGARCNDASPAEADQCVEKIAAAPRVPKGLGIFGAMKPALVQRFAACMADSTCGPSGGASSCFGEMLGEDGEGDSDGGDDEAPAAPVKPVKPSNDAPGTKI